MAASVFTTFREFFERILPPWLQEEVSSGFVGVVFALVGDTNAEAAELAVRAPWLLDPSSPDDVLPLIGLERRMPRYPSESAAQYRARLHGAWDAYQFGGDESAILGQLAAAGFPGARIYDPGNWGRGPTGYWSQFWVFFPSGTHPVTSQGPSCGSGPTCGDGTICGPVGITPEQLRTLRAIVRKWKSTRWIARQLIFEVSGPTCGTGHLCGDGSICGGVVVTTAA